MKLRNLYEIISAAVGCGLLIVGLAGFGVGGRLLTTAGCIVVAVGVIWFVWSWRSLTKEITSMAAHIKDGSIKNWSSRKAANARDRADHPADQLAKAVADQIGMNFQRISELEKSNADLHIQVQLSKHQKRNTDAIIYSIRDAVIVTDECDRLLMANEAAGRIFNFDHKNSQFTPIAELVDPARYELVNFLRQCRSSQVRATKREINIAHTAPDQPDKIFDCIVSCVFNQGAGESDLANAEKDNNQQVCGVVAVLHDVTREKEISQMKNDFVSHVSHELKTPLASISAYSEMLLDGEAADEEMQREFCSIIQNQAQRLNRLIEDILNIARIESGMIKVDKHPLSLTILIEEQLQMIRSYAEEKNICLKDIGKNPIVHDQVDADKDMISQVIVNLLSNAVKYTPAGGSIKIDTEVDDAEQIARVSIADTGIGIPADEVEHVFDKFYRVGVNKKQAKGTGLGLNLVKQIVEVVHGGKVFVRSEQGVGSTFGFELPLASSTSAEKSVNRDSKQTFEEAK